MNQLLSALPSADYQRLEPHLQAVSLERGKILYDVGQSLERVYFPCDALVSLVAPFSDREIVEFALVGKAGIVGIAGFLGGNFSQHRALVQIPGQLLSLEVAVLQAEFQNSSALRALLLRYTQALLTQIAQNAACASHHRIDRRLARWLLLVQDSLSSNYFFLTQKYMAMLLGTRRATVTTAAKTLREQGFINYDRGQIEICDREGLRAWTCECYDIIRQESERLLALNGD
jgi:CRP-like cAMP-binding protein